MKHQHLINSLVVALDFEHQAPAEKFQQQSATFVKTRLLPIAEQIFAQQSRPGEVISIDKLEIDLGDISGPMFLSQLEGKFKETLQRTLMDITPSEGGGQGTKGQADFFWESSSAKGVSIYSEQMSRLQQLEFYLIHGVMPWNFDPLNIRANDSTSHSSSPSTPWLEQALGQNLTTLITLLQKHPLHRRNILTRLYHQASRVLALLARQLAPDEQLWLVDWLAQQPKTAKRKALTPFYQFFWQQKIALALLNAQGGSLQENWRALITEHQLLLVQALRYYGQQARVRTSIADSFSGQMMHDIIVLLEPTEHVFVTRMLRQSALFNQSGNKALTKATKVNKHRPIAGELVLEKPGHNVSGGKTKSLLWQFTLDYLLAERGSRFNRKLYLASVIGKMAQHHNLSQRQMLESLLMQLPATSDNTGLSREMGQMLTDIRHLLLGHKDKTANTVNTVRESWSESAGNKALHENLTKPLTKPLTKHIAKPLTEPLTRASLTEKAHSQSKDVSLQLVLTRAIIEGSPQGVLPQWPLILAQYREVLTDLLRFHGQALEVRRKLVQGFSESMLGDMLVVLEPVHHGFVRQFLDNAAAIFTAGRLRGHDSGPGEKQRKSVLWEFTLAYLLVEKGSEFNKSSYLASITEKMAAHNNLHYHQLLVSLYQSVEAFTGSSTLKLQLQQVLQGLTRKESIKLGQLHSPLIHARHGEDSEALLFPLSNESARQARVLGEGLFAAAAALSREFSDPEILTKLVEAIVKGDDSFLAGIWQPLLDGHRELLKALLAYHGRLARVRNQLATGCSESRLKDIAGLLAPGAKGFILAILENTQLFQVIPGLASTEQDLDQNTGQGTGQGIGQGTGQEVGDGAGQSARKITALQGAHALPSRRAVKQSLWEFTLTYLLVERGSIFNNKSYLASMIRQMSAHRNLSYPLLVTAMLSAMRDNNLSGSFKSQVLALLEEFKEKDKAQREAYHPDDMAYPHSVVGGDKIKLYLEAYDHYLALKDYLCGKKSFPKPGIALPLKGQTASEYFSQCLTYLSRYQPLLLLRLLKESQTGVIRWPQVVAVLSQKELEQLIRAFLSLNYPSHSRELDSKMADFMQSLTAASQTLELQNKQQQFFVLLLSAMAKGDPLDFDAFIGTVQAGAVQGNAMQDDAVTLHQATDSTGTDSTGTDSTETDSADIHRARPSTKSAKQLIREYFSQEKGVMASEQLTTALEQMLTGDPRTLKPLVLTGLATANICAKVIRELPEVLLIRLLLLLQPGQYLVLKDYARLLTLACYHYDDFKQKLPQELTLEQLHYRYICHYLITQGRAFDLNSFVAGFIRYFTDIGLPSEAKGDSGQALTQFLLTQLKEMKYPAQQTIRQHLVTTTRAYLGQVQLNQAQLNQAQLNQTQLNQTQLNTDKAITGDTGGIVYQGEIDNSPQPKASQTNWLYNKGKENDELAQSGDPISVENAGLVLATPYIPRLFDMLALVNEGSFKGQEQRQRGMLLLQYMVDASSQTPEYLLALNKVLSGIKIAAPVPCDLVVSDQEKTVISGLLTAIIAHWSSLGNTSVEGLQQTFLQRPGVLTFVKDSWQLEVSPAPFDMLLDQLPWSYSLIKYPWMQHPLHVQWR